MRGCSSLIFLLDRIWFREGLTRNTRMVNVSKTIESTHVIPQPGSST